MSEYVSFFISHLDEFNITQEGIYCMSATFDCLDCPFYDGNWKCELNDKDFIEEIVRFIPEEFL